MHFFLPLSVSTHVACVHHYTTLHDVPCILHRVLVVLVVAAYPGVAIGVAADAGAARTRAVQL